MLHVIGFLAGAFVASLALVPLCGIVARRLGYVAAPKQDRWHTRPTPLFGSIGIAVPVLAGALLALPIQDIWVVLAGSGVIFLVGLTDDVVNLKPSTKLVAEIGLASLFLFFGYRLEWVESPTLDTMLTMLWIVGLTNAFNLLDNMDGLCAGIALIVGGAMLATLVTSIGVTWEVLLLALLIGATGGFLVYNFNPARIFMGDSGSLFIGLILATISLRGRFPGETPAQILAIIAGPLLVLLIPILDTTLVTVSRLLSGRRPSQGGRDHCSHRLVAMGLSERAAVTVLWSLAATGGLIGVLTQRISPSWSGLLAAIFVVAMAIFAAYLAQVRVYDTPVGDILVRSGKITPFIAQFLHKRRVAEVLLDVCLILIAYYSAYRVRFEGPDFQLAVPKFLESLPVVLGIQMTVLFVVGGYRGVWRHFGLMDGVVFGRGVFLGTLMIVAALTYLYRFEHYSRGVFVVYAAILMLLLTGSRASFRLISEFAKRRQIGRRLLIYGAGDGGSLIVRELLGNPLVRYKLVGFIDDDPVKHRARVQGYPVLGGYDRLVSMISSKSVDCVVISARLIRPDRLTTLEGLCAEHSVDLSQLHLRLEPLVAVS